jgi:hypothetical protein
MIIILLLAVATMGMVAMGLEGRGRARAPKLARQLSRAARHLNGDGQPPKQLVKLIEQAPLALGGRGARR